MNISPDLQEPTVDDACILVRAWSRPELQSTVCNTRCGVFTTLQFMRSKLSLELQSTSHHERPLSPDLLSHFAVLRRSYATALGINLSDVLPSIRARAIARKNDSLDESLFPQSMFSGTHSTYPYNNDDDERAWPLGTAIPSFSAA